MNHETIIKIFEKIILIANSGIGYVESFKNEDDKMALKIKKGGIRQRPDGRFETRITIAGETITTGYSQNKTEAINNHNKKLDDLLPKAKKSSNFTLFNWIDEYLAVKKSHVSVSTYKHNEIIVRLHIKPKIKDMPLKRLKAMDIEKLLVTSSTERIKEDVYKLLAEFLKKAKQNDLIDKNPCDFIKPIKAKRNKGIALTTEEQKKVFAEIEKSSKIKEIYYFMLYSGARPDEALRMKWEYINWTKETVYIDGTKNQTSARIIPLFQNILQLLQKNKKAEGDIFPFSYTVLKKDCSKLRELTQINFTPKTFRHTFGTRLYEKNIDMKLISKWMGHAKLETTENIYIDVLSEFENTQAKNVNFN